MATTIPWVRNPDGTPGEVLNPSVGCSFGCPFCYMRPVHNRRWRAYHDGKPVPKCYRQPFEEPLFLPERLGRPLRWRKPRTCFIDSAGDLLDPAISFEEIAAVLGVVAACPSSFFLLLTKRAERLQELLGKMDPLPNLGLGVSVTNQRDADKRIPYLLRCPAALRYVSYEPARGPLKLTNMDVEGHPAAKPRKGGSHIGWYWLDVLTGKNDDMGRPCPRAPKIDWLVVGAQSGPGAKPMPIEWARSARDQAVEAGVPFFYKAGPGDHGPETRKMPPLDGQVWDQVPEVLRCRD